jgi:hypothetical protein
MRVGANRRAALRMLRAFSRDVAKSTRAILQRRVVDAEGEDQTASKLAWQSGGDFVIPPSRDISRRVTPYAQIVVRYVVPLAPGFPAHAPGPAETIGIAHAVDRK